MAETENSKAQRRAVIAVLAATALSVATAIAIDVGFGWLRPQPSTRVEALKVKPSADRVYLLGNSIFKTGISVRDLEAHLGGSVGVDFEEHVGHYTNLWYLMVKNALVSADPKPRLLVWGFRPTYANRPGFRQRKVCDIERFHGLDEDLYEHMTSDANAEGAARWRGWLSTNSNLYPRRVEIRERLFSVLQNRMLYLLNRLAGPAAVYIEADLTSGFTLSEVIKRQVERGSYRMAEEALVDRGKEFVVGPTVPFAKSFVPVIAEMIKQAGIPQLVLIFKPASELTGEPDAEIRSFTRDAVAYFESSGIASVNFLDEPRIQLSHYAAGDHYNEDGRQLMTLLLAEAISSPL